MTINDAIESLKLGEFVLIYDSDKRENEVDIMVAAEFITPEHIARMRQHAGGLICVAVENMLSDMINIRYMHDILYDTFDKEQQEMVIGLTPYGDHPTFSISVNHYKTYTGITDSDRALTIKELTKLFRSPNPNRDFISSFRTPGHVPILIAEDGLLFTRRGHTELAVYLAQTAELVPAAVICEMMDAETYSALSIDKARKYAKDHGIPFVDGRELVEKYTSKVH
jgi:3,4-dihydroxy 2-butanone 4-phosphate synthase